MSEWKQFKDGHPQLGMTIEVRTDKGVKEMGKVVVLRDLGEGAISMTTSIYLNAAARPYYEWREVEHQSQSDRSAPRQA